MFESTAMLKYICERRDLPHHWYPRGSDLESVRKRAKIDTYLDWHHSNVRIGAGYLIFGTYFEGFMTGKWSSEAKLNAHRVIMERSFDKVLKVWLTSEKVPFLFGDKPTIADLQFGQELVQLVAIDYPL
mmetsp:Transcript_42754/g.65705  ORF Transcript_42754/g.65705 Transcript_42754/m.65705 type:complete len:129 (+) Transcript_42754:245-631(+)